MTNAPPVEQIEKAREDFRIFMWIIFKKYLYDILKDPTPLQYDIADFLCHHKASHKVIMAFRGIGKSYITALYCVWRLWNDPTLSILVVSASKEKSDQVATQMIRLFKDVPFLRHLDPENDKRRGARTSKLSFDVIGAGNKQSPSVRSAGITGMITGSRADIILADDVEIPENSDTPMKRAKLRSKIEEFEAILRTDDEDTDVRAKEVIFLGTPQSQESIYNDLPQEHEFGYTVRQWPAEYPKGEEELRYYGKRLAPMIRHTFKEDAGLVGTATDTRFNEHQLNKKRSRYGRSGYALQFLLNTQLSDTLRYPLQCRDLIFMDLDPEVHPEKPIWASDTDCVIPTQCQGFEGDYYHRPMQVTGEWVRYEGSVMAVDPSGRGHDETAYCILKWGNGYLYVLDVGAVKGGFDPEALKSLALVANKWKVRSFLVERNFGGGMFGQLMRPMINKYAPECGMVPEDEMPFHTTQKELRIISTCEPVMNNHRVVMNRNLIDDDLKLRDGIGEDEAVYYRFFHQLTRLTRDRGCLRHDDRLDAFAMAIKFAQDAMGIDPEANMQARAKANWEEAMDRYLAADQNNGRWWASSGVGHWSSTEKTEENTWI